MFLAPGAQFCPNCQLNLAQFAYQQQHPQFQPPVGEAPESKKEKLYRKVLIAICIALFAEIIIQRMPGMFGGSMFYTLMKPFRYISELAWAGLPLFIALILPKKNGVRVLFIVLASLYAAWSLWNFVYYEFFYYNMWDDGYDYDPY